MAADLQHVTVGEYDGETAHDVFDLAVAIGELAGAATGNPPADGRELEGLGEVTDRPANLTNGLLKFRSEDTRLDAHES